MRDYQNFLSYLKSIELSYQCDDIVGRTDYVDKIRKELVNLAHGTLSSPNLYYLRKEGMLFDEKSNSLRRSFEIYRDNKPSMWLNVTTHSYKFS